MYLLINKQTQSNAKNGMGERTNIPLDGEDFQDLFLTLEDAITAAKYAYESGSARKVYTVYKCQPIKEISFETVTTSNLIEVDIEG